MWLVSLDPTAGHEQQGTRPVLITRRAAFNRPHGGLLAVPVSSAGLLNAVRRLRPGRRRWVHRRLVIFFHG
uniref:type II toxin-antitoxin system PemK/MazF family toxin n=1 Tax=Klebsiella pneumoniae TaxID=573 RepID=UPI0022BA555D|nr:type II toxin-antitoxin system PemK/MazF family toxin [Klebsiella pneumoniae]